MTIGVLRLFLFIPDSNSLKAKRSVLNTLKKRLASKFSVCVAEVDFQDKWQKASLAVGFISTDRRVIDSTFSRIIKFVDAGFGVELIDYQQELL